MFDRSRLRSPLGLAAIVALTAGATGAGAATIHRFAVSQTTGSEGATTFLQSSASSSALQGEVAASPRTSIQIPFGVLGEYDATGSTFGIGVAGISTTGYAVGAEALGANPAVLAEGAGTSEAIEAVGKNYDGIDSYVDADGDYAVYGEDDSPDQTAAGVVGFSTGQGGAGLVGINLGGPAIIGDSESQTPGAPALQAESETPGTELFDGVVLGSDSNAYEVASLTYPSANASGLVLNASAGGNADLQVNGDIYTTGALFSGCPNSPETDPLDDCDNVTDSVARTNHGDVRAYGARNAAPTMEDAGEARLVNGYAHVSLDPTFASAISTKVPYLVFPAPQGDSRGLYVTNRTPGGFDVRENAGGKSTMTFDYRIVAKPFASESKRMAYVQPHRGTHNGMLAKRFASRYAKLKSSYQTRHLLGHPKSLVNFTGMQTR